MSDLLFFPMSMPDEILHSRITRYHFLSGNKTAGETFRDLFGSEPFSVGMLPKQIEMLAYRLPGDTASNLDELICTNTTFPAYRPFLGIGQELEGSALGRSFSGVVRVPRREGAVHGKANLCPTCVQQDLLEVGYAYWHRSHHLPGVSVCWRHGDPLIHSCPNCFHPFFRKLRMLPSLTEPCVCGWSVLAPATVNNGTHLEKKFAEFAHELLQRNMPIMSSETLSSSYVRQCRKRGFIHGKFTGTAKLFESIRDKYGDGYLSKIDKAYEDGKHNQWIRFNASKGQLDMPLTRHMIIALHLFGSIDEFEGSLRKEAILKTNLDSKPSSLPKKSSLSIKEKYRQKVSTVISIRTDASLEMLWKNAYQATRWLYENDNAWLVAQLSTPGRGPYKVEYSSDPRDSKFAAILLGGVEGLYRVSKGQKRVNITNLQKLLPTRLPPDPSTRKRRFPIASQQMELLQESVWHFRLRRLICAFDDLNKLNLPINNTNIRMVSTVPPLIIPVIISFFEWDIESFSKNGFEPEALLKSTGVSRNWQGPPGFNSILGGSAYVAKSKSCLLQKTKI